MRDNRDTVMPTPDPYKLLAELQDLGVELRVERRKLLYRDPEGALDSRPQLRDELRRFKGQVAFAIEHPPTAGFGIDRPWERERQAYAEM
jgi:hypothetical protein